MPRRLLAAAFSAALLTGCTLSEVPRETTTTLGPAPSDLVLSPDGMLPFRVGRPAEEVSEGIGARFGGNDRETEWMPGAASIFGDCPTPEVRGVGWGSLYVIEERVDGGARFLTWTYGFDHERGESGDPRRLGLTTAEGIGLGSTRDELEAAYGNRLDVVVDEEADIVNFTIDGNDVEHIRGRLSGPGPDDVVDYLERVPGCSHR